MQGSRPKALTFAPVWLTKTESMPPMVLRKVSLMYPPPEERYSSTRITTLPTMLQSTRSRQPPSLGLIHKTAAVWPAHVHCTGSIQPVLVHSPGQPSHIGASMQPGWSDNTTAALMITINRDVHALCRWHQMAGCWHAYRFLVPSIQNVCSYKQVWATARL